MMPKTMLINMLKLLVEDFTCTHAKFLILCKKREAVPGAS